jgi:hypothetical protein
MAMWRIVAAAGLVALCGCSVPNDPNAAFSTVRVAPMGPGQYAVSCVDGVNNCVRQTNKLCPSGYDVTSNVVNPRDFGRMTMIIRCR